MSKLIFWRWLFLLVSQVAFHARLRRHRFITPEACLLVTYLTLMLVFHQRISLHIAFWLLVAVGDVRLGTLFALGLRFLLWLLLRQLAHLVNGCFSDHVITSQVFGLFFRRWVLLVAYINLLYIMIAHIDWLCLRVAYINLNLLDFIWNFILMLTFLVSWIIFCLLIFIFAWVLQCWALL